jgi:hypothetical protein
MSAKRCAAAILVLVLSCAGASLAAAADNTLATARDLYAAAAYEDALVILNQLSEGTHGPDDRKNWSEAAERFNYVLDVLNDPDVRPVAAQPPLSDLKVLAQGFRDLAVTAATPPPAPPKPEPPPPPPVVVAAAEPAVPAAPRIYQATDKGVVPPITVRQNLPPFPSTAAVPKQAQGVLEVIIDETGAVEQVLMRVPLNAAYDRQALLAAKSWLYQPAMMNGKPVKFRKAVQINVAR